MHIYDFVCVGFYLHMTEVDEKTGVSIICLLHGDYCNHIRKVCFAEHKKATAFLVVVAMISRAN